MKKQDLKKLTVLGLTGAVLMAQGQLGAAQQYGSTTETPTSTN